MRTVSTRRVYEGRVVSLRVDELAMPDGGVVTREVIEHPGAVGVVALSDTGQVLMVQQYRHPVQADLLELPAGLLDVAGEPAWQAARRELAEEGGTSAARWDVLVDVLPTPGGSDEAYRTYLARDLSQTGPPAGFVAADEEAHLTVQWIDLEVAVDMVLAGRIRNGMACVGLLAAARSAACAHVDLRPADAAWPDRPEH
jgi:8-oxo-dGTP pyrophosphatase MutT (NUDIX family)